jgi:hypothetical protein
MPTCIREVRDSGRRACPNAMTPVTSLRVKSVIASPANEATVDVGKPAVVRGTAWTGDAVDM